MENHLASSDVSISNFAAYIPSYDNGNVVTAITKDGQTVTINNGIKSFIKGLVKRSGIDHISIRNNLTKYIGKKMFMPLPLSMDTILIPVKTREKVYANDGAYAYINMYSIEKISGDKNCVIRLKCGRDIKVLESLRTVEERVKVGNTVMDKYSSRVLGDIDFKECISGIKGEYDKAATKGDMMLIAYELMRLRNLMEK